jgi:adenosylcobinamide kinase / adenosylcobinamide-phosphate guanylyltransferase
MQARIARHRGERPGSWQTIEEPLAVPEACERAARHADAVVVDCLTLWLSNLLWEHRTEPPGLVEETGRNGIARIRAAARSGHIILVSNEVGCATVPEAAVTRVFRDLQGLLNQCAAEAADEVIFTVAGLPLYLKSLEVRQ